METIGRVWTHRMGLIQKTGGRVTRDTKKGDLVLLWRTTPKKDIGYLIQTASDAYSIADDPYAYGQGWETGCDYQVLYKFAHPVTIQDLHDDSYFHDWGPLKARFRTKSSSFRIPKEFWDRLNQLASDKNLGYRAFIAPVQMQRLSKHIEREDQLEEALVNNLGLLKKFGYDLELYTDTTTRVTGRQLICKGNGGRMDLLCYDRQGKRYVVIELKNVRASQNTFGQISNYVGWVQDRVAGSSPVIGLVISRGYDAKFESSRRVTDRVFQLDLKQLGFDRSWCELIIRLFAESFLERNKLSEEKWRGLNRLVWREGDMEVVYDPHADKDCKKRLASARAEGREKKGEKIIINSKPARKMTNSSLQNCSQNGEDDYRNENRR